MKAVIWTRYGPPDSLQLREIEKPTPGDNEVLIKIYATTVTLGDCEMRRLKFPVYLLLPMRVYFGFFRPHRIKILGQELSGKVESVGKDVKRFKAGDRIFAVTEFKFGAYAEYICLPENGTLAVKPANVSYEEAASVPVGGLNALHFLRKANIRRGQKVLVNGAGGSIGTIAVQIAKASGAEVTAVDTTGKLDMLRSIGADHAIDYTREDFTKSDRSYDVIFDVVGKAPYARCMRVLKEKGIYLLGNPSLLRVIRSRWTSITGSKKIVSQTASYKTEDLIILKELVEAEKIKPVIDRTYPLEQIPEAHRYVETGLKKGNVVITMVK